MIGYAAAAAVACAAGVAGGMGAPRAADAALRRAYRRSHAWWWESYQAYCSFKGSHPDAEPRASAPGEEGALGIWRGDALRAARAGVLPRERLDALADTGIPVDGCRAARSEADQQRRCSYAAAPLQRAALAVAAAAGVFAVGALGLGAVASAALWACGFAMAVGVVCDVRARMIPLECCAALAAAGAVFQVCAAGLPGLAAGAGAAVLVATACAVANKLGARLGPLPVGQGDVRCMVALALASGFGTLFGAAACYGAAAAYAVLGLLAGKLSLKDGIPMAPFLSAWLACGTAAAVIA